MQNAPTSSQQIEELLIDWEIAKKDPWSCIRQFVYTWDEHEHGPLARSKAFPNKAMYRIIARVWRESDVVFVEKSRQIMMTWIVAALFLWSAMFEHARRHFFQSKKQEDGDAVLKRAKHIYQQLRELSLPGLPEAKMTGEKLGTSDKLEFPGMMSVLQAIPQGGDIVASYTPSGIFSDEHNLQPEFEEAYAAAMPAIEGGGKFWAQGTARGKNFIYRMLRGIDELTLKKVGPHKVDSKRVEKPRFVPPVHLSDEDKRFWIEDQLLAISDNEFDNIPLDELVACAPGMRYWITADNLTCLRVHYTADPYKDPVTEIGKEWFEGARARMSTSKWEREMEIRYDTFDGRPVIKNWSTPLFVKNPPYQSDEILRLSFDFGAQLCGCAICQYVRIDGFNAYQLRFLDEVILRAPEANTPDMGRRVVDKIRSRYSRSWENNNILSYCDPLGNIRSATTSDNSLNTNIKCLKAVGIYPDSRKFGCYESTELLETVHGLILPNGEPAVVYHDRCEYLISCVAGGLHFPPDGKGKPGHYEKDGEFDHGGDIIRYIVANCFDEYALTGQQDQTPRQPQLVRRKYTGEIIGRRRNSRINSRRGTHVVRA